MQSLPVQIPCKTRVLDTMQSLQLQIPCHPFSLDTIRYLQVQIPYNFCRTRYYAISAGPDTIQSLHLRILYSLCRSRYHTIPAGPDTIQSLHVRILYSPCRSRYHAISAGPDTIQSLHVRILYSPCRSRYHAISAGPDTTQPLKAVIQCIYDTANCNCTVSPTCRPKYMKSPQVHILYHHFGRESSDPCRARHGTVQLLHAGPVVYHRYSGTILQPLQGPGPATLDLPHVQTPCYLCRSIQYRVIVTGRAPSHRFNMWLIADALTPARSIPCELRPVQWPQVLISWNPLQVQ